LDGSALSRRNQVGAEINAAPERVHRQATDFSVARRPGRRRGPCRPAALGAPLRPSRARDRFVALAAWILRPMPVSGAHTPAARQRTLGGPL